MLFAFLFFLWAWRHESLVLKLKPSETLTRRRNTDIVCKYCTRFWVESSFFSGSGSITVIVFNCNMRVVISIQPVALLIM